MSINELKIISTRIPVSNSYIEAVEIHFEKLNKYLQQGWRLYEENLSLKDNGSSDCYKFKQVLVKHDSTVETLSTKRNT